METQKKEKFGSKLGFILAAAGSAVGLGNIWRFPYLAAKYGGGFFLIVYIILAITFGFTLMLTEIAIGRKTGRTAISAYTAINKRFGFLGILATLVPFIITPYYCVIGGWVVKYFTVFLKESTAKASAEDGFFGGFISQTGSPTLFFIIFVALTSIAVLLGVQKGIEKISKFMMPALLVLIIAIAVYTMTLPGAMDGVKYYLIPNFDDFSIQKLLETIASASGQLFYSMSIAMGILITYGSYMRKEDSLEKSVRQIEIFDTAVALLAGLIIIPAVFVFSGGDKSTLNAGPSLMFVTMPKVFGSMQLGTIIGAAFFLLVILAALTSSISLLETISSIICEKFKLSRIVGTLISIAITIGVGMLSILGYSIWSDFNVPVLGMQILDSFDFLSNNILMPIVAFVTCILIGYVAKTKYIEDEVLVSEPAFKARKMYKICVMAVCPILMIVVLITPFVFSI